MLKNATLLLALLSVSLPAWAGPAGPVGRVAANSAVPGWPDLDSVVNQPGEPASKVDKVAQEWFDGHFTVGEAGENAFWQGVLQWMVEVAESFQPRFGVGSHVL